MKLSRLEGKTTAYSRDAMERAAHAGDQAVRRVEAMEGMAGDRERSVRQEVDLIEPGAIGPFEGAGHVLDEARAVAGQLAELDDMQQLIDTQAMGHWRPGVDDEA